MFCVEYPIVHKRLTDRKGLGNNIFGYGTLKRFIVWLVTQYSQWNTASHHHQNFSPLHVYCILWFPAAFTRSSMLLVGGRPTCACWYVWEPFCPIGRQIASPATLLVALLYPYRVSRLKMQKPITFLCRYIKFQSNFFRDEDIRNSSKNFAS